MADDPIFEVNELVQAYYVRCPICLPPNIPPKCISSCNYLSPKQKNRLYQAQVIHIVRSPDKIFKYKIHYKGWNKRLDEYLTADRIVKSDQNYVPVRNQQFLSRMIHTMPSNGDIINIPECPQKKGKRL